MNNDKYIIKYPNAHKRASHESGTLIEDKKTQDKVYLFYALKRLLAEGVIKNDDTPDGVIIIDGGLGKITLSTEHPLERIFECPEDNYRLEWLDYNAADLLPILKERLGLGDGISIVDDQVCENGGPADTETAESFLLYTGLCDVINGNECSVNAAALV